MLVEEIVQKHSVLFLSYYSPFMPWNTEAILITKYSSDFLILKLVKIYLKGITFNFLGSGCLS